MNKIEFNITETSELIKLIDNNLTNIDNDIKEIITEYAKIDKTKWDSIEKTKLDDILNEYFMEIKEFGNNGKNSIRFLKTYTDNYINQFNEVNSMLKGEHHV